jgi:hypothetical protein
VPSSRSLHRLPAVLLALCVFATHAPAQQPKVPVQSLGKPDAAFDDPFTQIAGLRELKNGDVIVADMRDRTLQRISFTTGAATAIAREGSGPNEYGFPAGVYALPGDSTAVYDLANQRYLLIDPAGKPAGTFRMEQEGSGAGVMILRAAQAVDARGRLYYSTRGERRMVDPDGGPPEFSDSGRVIRYDRATKRTDTLGVVFVPKPRVEASGGPNNRNVMVRPAPMAPEDAWGVAPDGQIGVARVTTDQVEWWMPDGKVVKGSPVPYAPIKVTEEDRQAWWTAMARGGVNIRSENGRTSIAPGSGKAPPMDPNIVWPATKPPFPANAVKVSPSGELWLLRSRPADDKIPTYDVFDASGRLVRQVRLTADTRLVAFGKGVVYLARKDADDLEYLERYRL